MRKIKRQQMGQLKRKSNHSGKAKAGKVRTIATWVYAIVIIGVFAGLLQVLNGPHDKKVAEIALENDPDVIAVLSSMQNEGSEIVAIDDLDKILPKEQEPNWVRYAEHRIETQKPKIAIVIDDLGMTHSASVQLSHMQGPYTLAFLPYADQLKEQTAMVRKAGHELMVHLPMQPHDKSANPGQNALLTDLAIGEFERRIEWNLSQFEGFVGVNNHMGSLMTEKAAPMVRVMVQLRRKGLLFLDSLTSPDSVGLRAARATGVPAIARDIFLDNERQVELITEQLSRTETIARKRGYAIAIGHPYPETLKALEVWRKTLKKKGLALVPLSQLVYEHEAATSQHTAQFLGR